MFQSPSSCQENIEYVRIALAATLQPALVHEADKKCVMISKEEIRFINTGTQ